MTDEEKRAYFLSHVSVPDDPNACWDWLGGKTSYGRNNDKAGVLTWEGRRQRAARVSYTLFCGPVARDQHVFKTCHSTLCVNPAHMWSGTMADFHARNPKKVPRRAKASTKANVVPDMRKELSALFRDVVFDRGQTVREVAQKHGISADTVLRLRRELVGVRLTKLRDGEERTLVTLFHDVLVNRDLPATVVAKRHKIHPDVVVRLRGEFR